MKLRASTFAFAALTFAGTLPASATVVLGAPDFSAIATATSTSDGTNSSGCTSCLSGSAVSGSGSASVNINLATTTESVSAGGSGTVFNGSSGSGDAQLFYQFAVIGPTTDAYIPVWVRANIAVTGQGTDPSGGNDWEGSGVMAITGGQQTIDNEACWAAVGPCNSQETQSSFINVEDEIPANSPINVGLRADAGGGGGSGVSVQVVADPYFFIDPTFLAANPGYSLEFSDGIGNAFIGLPGAVPEPATWIVFIVGFGAVGGVLRRSRSCEAKASPVT